MYGHSHRTGTLRVAVVVPYASRCFGSELCSRRCREGVLLSCELKSEEGKALQPLLSASTRRGAWQIVNM